MPASSVRRMACRSACRPAERPRRYCRCASNAPQSCAALKASAAGRGGGADAAQASAGARAGAGAGSGRAPLLRSASLSARRLEFSSCAHPTARDVQQRPAVESDRGLGRTCSACSAATASITTGIDACSFSGVGAALVSDGDGL